MKLTHTVACRHHSLCSLCMCIFLPLFVLLRLTYDFHTNCLRTPCNRKATCKCCFAAFLELFASLIMSLAKHSYCKAPTKVSFWFVISWGFHLWHGRWYERPIRFFLNFICDYWLCYGICYLHDKCFLIGQLLILHEDEWHLYCILCLICTQIFSSLKDQVLSISAGLACFIMSPLYLSHSRSDCLQMQYVKKARKEKQGIVHFNSLI